MSKEIKIDLQSAPPSKKEIDCCIKSYKFKNTFWKSLAIIFFATPFFLTCLEIEDFFIHLLLFSVSIILFIIASLSSNNASLLESTVISEKMEENIMLLLPDDIIKKYLEEVKAQGRVLISLEVRAITHFFEDRYPNIQLEKLISDCKKQDVNAE